MPAALNKAGRLVKRLKTRAQFQAVLQAGVVARTHHFALHRGTLESCILTGHISQTERARRDAPKHMQQPDFVVQTTESVSSHTRLIEPFAWFGAMVPKRWARRAATRNSIKRQIYGLVQSIASQLPLAAYVVRLSKAFDKADFKSASSSSLKVAVRAELETLLMVAKVQVVKPKVPIPALGLLAVTSAQAPNSTSNQTDISNP